MAQATVSERETPDSYRKHEREKVHRAPDIIHPHDLWSQCGPERLLARQEPGEQGSRVNVPKDDIPDNVDGADETNTDCNGPLQWFEGQAVVISDQQQNSKNDNRS